MSTNTDQSPTETMMAPVFGPMKAVQSTFGVLIVWIFALAATLFALSAFLFYLYRRGQPLGFTFSMIVAAFIALIVPIILTIMLRRVLGWRSAGHTAMLFLAVTALMAIVFTTLSL